MRPSMQEREDPRAEFSRVALPEIANIYRAAAFLIKDKMEAEDLVQETYLRAFRFFHRFQRGTNCKAWLLRILRNLFLNRYQQTRREPRAVDPLPLNDLHEAAADPGLSSYGMDDEIARAMRELPEDFRTVVVLVDMEGLSYRQAAKAMDSAVGTVRSRLCRARRLLQARLRDYGLRNGFIKGPGL